MLSAAALGPCKPATATAVGRLVLPRRSPAARAVPNSTHRRQRLVVAARQRATGRSTASQPPPVDPDSRTRAFRRSPSGRKAPEKEPFDAELFVLFGLPCGCLLVAYAFNEPSSLAVAIPLGLLIPGVRDVLLHVGTDAFRAVRRAARFVSVDSADAYSEEEEAAAEEEHARQEGGMRWWQQRRQQQQQPAWGRRVPPPPPPPPPPPAPQAEYELRAEDYAVYPSPPAQPAPEQQQTWPQQQTWQPEQQQPSWQQQAWQPQQGQQQQQQASWQQQPGQPGQQQQGAWQSEQQPPSPFAQGWQQQQVPRSPFAEGWPQQRSPRSPFAQGWPQQQVPQSPFADGWPPAGASGSIDAGHGSWQQAPGPSSWNASPAPESSGSWRFRRRSSGGSPTAAATPAAPTTTAMAPPRRRRQGRLAQPGAQGRARVTTGAERRRDLTPLLLRPLFTLIPFLRYWGGFL